MWSTQMLRVMSVYKSVIKKDARNVCIRYKAAWLHNKVDQKLHKNTEEEDLTKKVGTLITRRAGERLHPLEQRLARLGRRRGGRGAS